MKVLRAVISLLIGFIVSYFLAVTFFNYSEYSSLADRFFLTLVPALAISILLFEAFPVFSEWLSRIQLRYSFTYYFFGYLLSLILTYGAVGFLSDVLKSSFSMVLFTAVFISIGSVCGYYLVRRAARSFREGFLSKPLNLILVLTLPLLLSVMIYAVLQFPVMFVWDYINVPQKWIGLFVATALIAGISGIVVLDKFESGGYYESFKKTKLFDFISKNIPGLYAGGMFFLINLMIARAINHPALSINSVLFESDAGPWMTILGSPASDVINRSVHPLVLIIVRPLIRVVGILMGDQWHLAPMLVTSATSGLCVFMAWMFVKRATDIKTYAFIFAILLGSTASHLLFGSLTENYIFGAASLILFFLLIQTGEKRFTILVPAGLLLFGITITNIAQGVIGLFFNKFGFRRLMQYSLIILASGIALTIFTSALYPKAQTFFFVPADIAFEFNFVKTTEESTANHLLNKFQVVSRTMFLYGAVGPSPIEVVSKKDPFPTIDFKTFDIRENRLASYKRLANIPLILWLILLAGSFVTFAKNIGTSKHLPIMLGLLGTLVFNFILHMVYGTELFLYTAYWMYALIFFIALVLSEFADKKWFESILTIIVMALMVNNFWFIVVILRGLAPFYAAIP